MVAAPDRTIYIGTGGGIAECTHLSSRKAAQTGQAADDDLVSALAVQGNTDGKSCSCSDGSGWSDFRHRGRRQSRAMGHRRSRSHLGDPARGQPDDRRHSPRTPAFDPRYGLWSDGKSLVPIRKPRARSCSKVRRGTFSRSQRANPASLLRWHQRRSDPVSHHAGQRGPQPLVPPTTLPAMKSVPSPKTAKIFVAVNDMQRGDTQLRGTKLTVPAAELHRRKASPTIGNYRSTVDQPGRKERPRWTVSHRRSRSSRAAPRHQRWIFQ